MRVNQDERIPGAIARSRRIMLGSKATMYRRPMNLVAISGLATALFAAMEPIHAELPSFDDFYQGVSQCRLDMALYHAETLVEPFSEGVVIALPAGGAVRGLVITAFYFSPGRGGGADQYGLVFNAPIDAVANAFPDFASRQTVNGYLRQLSRLSDETGDEKDTRKTLLVCKAGTAL